MTNRELGYANTKLNTANNALLFLLHDGVEKMGEDVQDQYHLTKSPLFDALHIKAYRAHADLVPPSTNQYCPILTLYHQISTAGDALY